MMTRNNIRTLRDLERERQKIRTRIRSQEKKLDEDLNHLLDSITPARILANLTGKIVSSAPALFTAYSLIKGFVRRKR